MGESSRRWARIAAEGATLDAVTAKIAERCADGAPERSRKPRKQRKADAAEDPRPDDGRTEAEG